MANEAAPARGPGLERSRSLRTRRWRRAQHSRASKPALPLYGFGGRCAACRVALERDALRRRLGARHQPAARPSTRIGTITPTKAPNHPPTTRTNGCSRRKAVSRRIGLDHSGTRIATRGRRQASGGRLTLGALPTRACSRLSRLATPSTSSTRPNSATHPSGCVGPSSNALGALQLESQPRGSARTPAGTIRVAAVRSLS